jgi:hypothetical protein
MTTATTTWSSVLPARFAPDPLRSQSEGTACLSAPDPMGAAGSRLRAAIAEFLALICLMGLRNDEPNVTLFRAEPRQDTGRDKLQQRRNTNATLTNRGRACRRL